MDWEWLGQDVPLGFDALHFVTQSALARRGYAAAQQAYRRETGPALSSVAVQGHARATRLLYLLEICLRYTLDAQGPTGQPLRRHASWSLDLLFDEVRRP